MKKTLTKCAQFLFAFLFMINTSMVAQYQIEWEKNFGGSSDEEASAVALSLDGGYAIAGWTLSDDQDISQNSGDKDFWVIKVGANGELEWEKTYGGTKEDVANSIQATTDGGYIVAGSSQSSDGFVGANYGYSDFWVIKLDAVGELEWEKNYGGTGVDHLNSIQQTIEGGFIVTGSASWADSDIGDNNGGSDVWVVKLDAQGEIEWENNFGGTHVDYAESIEQTDDGGYIVGANSMSTDIDVSGNNGTGVGATLDFWIIKISAQGNIEWASNFGGNSGDRLYSAIQTNDGGYMAVGHSNSITGTPTNNNGFLDFWAIKLDPSGLLEWEKNYGGTGADAIQSVHQTADNNYIFVGFSKSSDNDLSSNNGGLDMWLVKADEDGNLIEQKNLGGSGDEIANDFQLIGNNGYLLVGESTSNNGDVNDNKGGNDFWIVKLSDQPVSLLDQPSKEQHLTFFPNPFENSIQFLLENETINSEIEIIIRNLMGQTIYDERVFNTKGMIHLDKLIPGVYYVTIVQGEYMTTEKIIKKP